jgi:hypothetical protein
VRVYRVPGSYHQKSAGSKVGESSAYIRQKKKNKKKFFCAWVTPKDLNFGSWRRKRKGAHEGGQLMDDKDLLHPHYTTCRIYGLPLTRCCYYYKPTWHCHNKEGIHLHPLLWHENCWTGECGSNAGAPAHMECSQSTVYNMSYRFPKKPNSSHFHTPIHLLQKKRGGCLSVCLSLCGEYPPSSPLKREVKNWTQEDLKFKLSKEHTNQQSKFSLNFLGFSETMIWFCFVLCGFLLSFNSNI